MSKLIPYSLLLMLTLNFSCDQKSDEVLFDEAIYSDEPLFYFSSNNEEYKIEAGVNGFYMFTEYEVDTMDVYSFVARFSKLSTCSFQCDEELTIKIRDFQSADTSTEILINEALRIGDYSFASNQNIAFGDVLIVYTDKDGTTFRTDLVNQDSESKFEILSISDFQPNENEQPTKKLNISFRCTLRDIDNGEEIFFSDATAVISVAYPE
jgi:hypothetical protein